MTKCFLFLVSPRSHRPGRGSCSFPTNTAYDVLSQDFNRLPSHIDNVHGMSQRRAPTGRTNSLGSAKVDCHTCQELGQRCDRQRPRCGTCINDHRQCAGFAVDLRWQNRAATAHIGTKATPKHGFRFAGGGTRSKRKTNGGAPRNRRRSSENAHDQPEESAMSSPSSSPIGAETSTSPEAFTPMQSTNLVEGDSFDAAGMEIVQFGQACSPAPSSVLFNDLAHRMEPVLDLCASNTPQITSMSLLTACSRQRILHFTAEQRCPLQPLPSQRHIPPL